MHCGKLEPFIKYPVYADSVRLFDRIAGKLGYSAAYCPVCGNITAIVIRGSNLRETCTCVICRSSNRQRQLAFATCAIYSKILGKKIRSLKDLARMNDFSVYNTESSGAIHKNLKMAKNYVCSEYLGPAYKSGEIIKEILHQDLMELSFKDNSFDLVISSDVLEHIPDSYKANREIYRVLKPGGRHIFTVPFYQTDFLDEERAAVTSAGETVFLKEPIYHNDPLRPEGVLVYRIFSLQMVLKLREIGFRTNLYRLYKPSYGILGNNAIVFEAIKE